MFDFANQAYTLLIITVIFGDLFTRVIVGDADNDYRLGNLLWSLSLATSYFLVVISAPVFGAIMDYSAARKQFLFASYVLTVVATALLYFVAPGFVLLGVLLIIVSNYAYSIGESFIASFLPDLGPPEDQGKISGFGWALGYVGGLVSTAFALMFLGEVSLENFDNVRWVGPYAAAFFLITAIPTFLWVRERRQGRRLPRHRDYLNMGMTRVRESLRDLRGYRDLAVFLLSVFFSMSGIYIIISFTFVYGAQVIGWDEQTRVLMFVTVQVTATLGAIGFGFIQDRIGARLTYNITLFLWILAILLIYATPQMTLWLRDAFDVQWQAQHVFLVVGTLAGMCLGACQSATRALVGIFSPSDKAAEFFGFWGLSNKLAGIVGLVGIGLLQVAVGLHQAILFCAVLFFLAFIVVMFVDQTRGRARAEASIDSAPTP
ncbi:MAG: MFS transporter [Chromatiales bacterium]|nr:MFS transporter [Chromatiales bacterium]MDX9768609.1 MFS transporter [Ectothiorhodospiraceae bacterium]